jgi:hypothetical protein
MGSAAYVVGAARHQASRREKAAADANHRPVVTHRDLSANANQARIGLIFMT